MEILDEEQNKYCRVEGCRFPWSHVTSNHLCPCGQRGHGQIECGNPNKINLLANYYNQILPVSKQCKFNTCNNKETHSTEAHHCENCGERNHQWSDCIIQSLDYHINKYSEYGSINLSMFDYHNFLIDFNNVYLDEYAGMGCTLFIRKKNNKVESLFMHSDAWGQYNVDNTPIYNKFIQGCDNITEIYRNKIAEQDQENRDNIENMDIDPHILYPDAANGYHDNDDNGYDDNGYQDNEDNINDIKCPMCRTQINSRKIREIKGSSDECKVCLDKNVELYFEECAHACICKDCFSKLQ